MHCNKEQQTIKSAQNFRREKKILKAGKTIYLLWRGKHLHACIQTQHMEESCVRALVLFILPFVSLPISAYTTLDTVSSVAIRGFSFLFLLGEDNQKSRFFAI